MAQKIGVFDSGIGGLTVLRKLEQKYPQIEFVYLSDSKNMPYGEKSRDEIIYLFDKAMDWFIERDISTVVIACTTCSNIFEYTSHRGMQFFGMIEAYKRACIGLSKIILLGTSYTIKAGVLTQAIESLGINVTPIALKSAAIDIENGRLEKVAYDIKDIVNRLIAEQIDEELMLNSEIDVMRRKSKTLVHGIDAIVYGCTHYSYIDHLLDLHIAKIDPADFVIL